MIHKPFYKERAPPDKGPPAPIDNRGAPAKTPAALLPTVRPCPDADLQALIERAYEDRAHIGADTHGDVREAVAKALDLLDSGRARVAEKIEGAEGPASWKVNQWLKKAVLLSFRLNDNAIVEGGPGGATWWDKVPSKFAGWGENRFREAGFAPCRAPSCATPPSSPATPC